MMNKVFRINKNTAAFLQIRVGFDHGFFES